jgi:hypothetical protein
LNRSHFATGSQRHRDPRFPPYAFTEHGAIQVANVLNSPSAVDTSIYVVRAFVQLREMLSSNKELARRDHRKVVIGLCANTKPISLAQPSAGPFLVRQHRAEATASASLFALNMPTSRRLLRRTHHILRGFDPHLALEADRNFKRPSRIGISNARPVQGCPQPCCA